MLLIGPGLAVSRLMAWVAWWIVLEIVGTVWVVTYVSYHADKRRAESGEWRIPEATLHFWELAGGWPAAFVAQRALRHKISKRSYQVIFWGIVTIHEYVAFDFLMSWKFTARLGEVARELIPW
jgi:uncharacterized membrane protein YsdA (DUF1294 family)